MRDIGSYRPAGVALPVVGEVPEVVPVQLGQRGDALRAASVRTNTLRFLLRLAHDLRLLSSPAYAFATEHLDEVGRTVGGWERASASRP
jgi:hypothetical protein